MAYLRLAKQHHPTIDYFLADAWEIIGDKAKERSSTRQTGLRDAAAAGSGKSAPGRPRAQRLVQRRPATLGAAAARFAAAATAYATLGTRRRGRLEPPAPCNDERAAGGATLLRTRRRRGTPSMNGPCRAPPRRRCGKSGAFRDALRGASPDALGNHPWRYDQERQKASAPRRHGAQIG